MKHKTRTKALSWLLSLAMLFSVVPGMSLTAYAATSHGITINTAQHGTVTASVNGSAATSAEEGATVTLTANPDNGYRLKSISGTYKGNTQETKGLNGNKTINGTYFNLNATDAAGAGWKLANNSTITITSKDTSVKIVKVDFNITQRGNSFNINNVSCSAGTKSLNGNTLSVSSINGTTVTLSSSVNNAGYVRFNSVTIYGTGAVDTNLSISTTGDVNVRTFTMPVVAEGNVSITAVFEELPKYSVTLTGGGNATASPSGKTTQTGLTGAMDTVTFTANTGYHFTEFTDITNNGITATRTNDTTVTVSGTPNADASIVVPDAELAHTHTWATGWTSNETYHWHACTGEGATDACLNETAAAKAEHSYGDTGDARFTCTVCEYVDTTKQAEAEAADLAAAKTAAKADLDALLDGKNAEDYDEADWDALTQAINDAKTAIDAATTLDAVEAAKTPAQQAEANTKTKEQKAAEALENAKTTAKNDLDTLQSGKNQNDYDAADWTTLTQAITDGKTAIDNATTTEAVNTAKNNAVDAVNAVKTKAQKALDDAKASAANTVNAVNANDYIAADQQTVTNAKTTALAAIEAATTEEEVTTALNNFNNAIASCTTQVVADQTAQVMSEVSAKTGSGMTYTGNPIQLINTPTTALPAGYTMKYAVTTENVKPTDENLYTTSIPTATDAGTYYVWYKAVGSDGDSAAAYVTVTVSSRSTPSSSSSSDSDSSSSTPSSTTTTTTTTDTTSNPDASTTDGAKTVTTTTNRDGSTTEKTTETATKSGGDGSKTEVKAESTTTTKSNTDGTTTAATTSTETATTTAADGTKTVTETKTEAKETLDKSGNGTVEAKTTETVKDASGKVTATTVTESKGTVETATDGTKTTTTTNTAVTTDAAGNKTTVVTTEKATVTTDGNTGKVVSDESGKVVSVEAKISETAAESAAKSGETVTLPVTVTAAQSAEDAAAVAITVPKAAESVKVEIPVEDVKPGTVAVIVHEDGTEEIVKTSTTSEGGVVLALESGASVKVVDNTKTFNDVDGSEWYADNVAWASSREVMNGVGNNTFAPNEDTNRAMVTQILYNLDDGKASGTVTTFNDVSAGDWYADSVSWAVENGIAQGEGESFGANDAVTREQLAVMLYNYAGKKDYDVSAKGDISRFADNDSASAWASDALAWAVGVGIINGARDAAGNTLLDPQGNASRAQVTAMTERFCQKAAK